MSLLITIEWLSNNFWLRSDVDFDQMMRQKYVISNIYVEDTQLQLLWGVKKQCN